MRRWAGVVLLVVVVAGCQSSTKSAAPAPADVAAAKACETLFRFTAGKASGTDVVNAAGPLLAGTAAAKAAGQPAPKWAQLGADLITVAGDPSSPAANSVVTECGSIPTAAKVAGGYTR